MIEKNMKKNVRVCVCVCVCTYMGSKEFKPVNLKGNHPRILFGRTDAEAEAPILWPPDENSLEKTLMLGEIESRRRGGDRG